jgi:pimeloyl-ACP methyl ester carboxylesterase
VIRIAFWLAVCASIASPAASDSPRVRAHSPVQLQQRDHISIRDEGGSGPAVILIPGLSSPRAVWDGIVPGLTNHHHVFTVQVNGFGGDDPRANLTPGILNGMVGEIDAYIVSRRLGAPALVGHSMGGLVAMMLVKAHRSHVGRMMIVDSLPYIGDSFRPGVTVAQVEPRARAMREQIAAGYGKPHDHAAAEAIANSLAATANARAQIRNWMLASDARVSAQAMYEDMTTDLRTDVAGFDLPITLIYPSAGDELYHGVFGKAPHVTYVPVADAGHFVMIDQPAAFAKALANFLA